MMKWQIAIAALLIPLIVLGQVGPVTNILLYWTAPSAPSGQDFADDFSTDPSSRWTKLSGSDWTWSSGNENVRMLNSGTYIYTNQQTDTVSQYAYVSYDQSNGGSAYAGLYFRSTNNATEAAYTVRYEEVGDDYRWRACEGHSCTTIASILNQPLTDDDFYGIEVTGTSDSTSVTIYDCGTTEPVGGDFSGCSNLGTMTDNPRSICTGAGAPVSYCTGSGTGTGADSGTYTGLYNGSSADIDFDDFGGGDS